MVDQASVDYVEARIAAERVRMEAEVARAIADGIRTALAAQKPKAQRGDSGGGSAAANLSLSYGTVIAPIDEGSAYVLLDGVSQEPVPISTLGLAIEGARVAVMHTPPSGAVAIGGAIGVPDTNGGGGGDPGVHIPPNALARWQLAARPPRSPLTVALNTTATLVWATEPKEFPSPDWLTYRPRQRQDGSGKWPTIMPIWINDEMMGVTNGVGFVKLTTHNPGIEAGTFDIAAGAFVGTGSYNPATGEHKTGGTGVIFVDSLGSMDPAGGYLASHVNYFNSAFLYYTGTAGDGTDEDPFAFTGVTHQASICWHGALSSKPEIGSQLTAPWTVLRAQGGTTAAAHAAGATIRGIDRADVVCVGDSITVPFGGDESYIVGVYHNPSAPVGQQDTDWRLNPNLRVPVGVDGWYELVARAMGSGGAGFRPIVHGEEWNITTFGAHDSNNDWVISPPFPGWFDVAYFNNTTDVMHESPADLFPFFGATKNLFFPNAHYAIVGVGPQHTAKWTPVEPFTGTIEVVFVESVFSEDFSYQVNGSGAWHAVPAAAPTFPRLARFPIACKNMRSITFRCGKVDGTAVNLALGGVIPHVEGTKLLVHDFARGGSVLKDLVRPFGTIPSFDGEYDGMRMFDGDPQSIFPKLVIAEFSNDVNRVAAIGLSAAVDEWVESWTTFRTRVGPYADIVAVLCSNQDRTTIPVGGSGVQVTDTVQQAFRDAAKTYLLEAGVAVLDLQEAWEADYSVTTPEAFWELGLIGNQPIQLHPTRKGYADIAARLIRMLDLGAGVGAGGSGGTITPEVLAQFSASGIVIPTRTSKIWPGLADTSIGAVIMTMGTKPVGAGRKCIIDIRVNGVTIFPSLADRPSFSSTDANPVVHVLPSAFPFNTNDLLECFVVDGGSGRDLEVLVVQGGGAASGGGGGPQPTTAKWGQFKWGDGTKWG